MTQDISAIVAEVKQKQEGDEKAFLHFLQAFDIDTLNQLYFIFNGGGSLRTPMQMLQLLIIPFSAFSGLIIVFMGSGNLKSGLLSVSNIEFFKTMIGLFIAVLGIISYLRMQRLTKEAELIKLSNRIIVKQRTMSIISFVLEEKYRALSSSS